MLYEGIASSLLFWFDQIFKTSYDIRVEIRIEDYSINNH